MQTMPFINPTFSALGPALWKLCIMTIPNNKTIPPGPSTTTKRPDHTNTHKSDRILAKLNALKEQSKVVDVEEEQIKLIFFILENSIFAFRGAQVKEIITDKNIIPVPGTPHNILGIINVRGQIESVLDIRDILQLSKTDEMLPGHIIITATEQLRSGILVASVEEVLDFPASRLHPPHTTFSPTIMELVAEETEFRGHYVAILNLEKIFARVGS